MRVSLAGVGNWIRSLGRLGPDGFRDAVTLPKRMYPPDDEIAQLSMTLRIRKTSRGVGGNTERVGSDGEQPETMVALRHSAVLEKTPGGVAEAPVRLDVDLPMWLPRG